MASYMQELDRIRDGVMERNPGWRVWWVPNSVTPGATWCARREPQLQAASPEELETLILAAEGVSPDSPLPGQ
jgi:hypothetical protein